MTPTMIANLDRMQKSIEALAEQIDAADKALVDAGIASVGSMADRIRQLAQERDDQAEDNRFIRGR